MGDFTHSANNDKAGTVTADGMRTWARGDYASEAGVELLIRSGLVGRAEVATAWPAGGGLNSSCPAASSLLSPICTTSTSPSCAPDLGGEP